jgi:hypothetical protein
MVATDAFTYSDAQALLATFAPTIAKSGVGGCTDRQTWSGREGNQLGWSCS